MEYNIGDIVKTKKKHPCGNDVWKINKIGIDFKMECTKCGHYILTKREKALKMIKNKIT